MVWTAPTCRSFPTGRHVGQWESGVMPAAVRKDGAQGEISRLPCHGGREAYVRRRV